ncbi:hypothetical protein NVS55_12230 [Myxococcus stipitatus]|uniref:hypothetical protein n=1 Tax=Myxococcus stipitatus TaxID=83455 RepID=UPI0031453237
MKFAYSVILAVLVFLLCSEIFRLWFDTRLYIGKFAFFNEGEEKSAEAKGFAQQVVHHHETLLHRLRKEEERLTSAQGGSSAARNVAGSPPPPDATFLPNEIAHLNLTASKLSDVELTIQGVNITQWLARLRQSISPPNELVGVVQKRGNGVYVQATWNQGPLRKAEGHTIDGRNLNVSGQPDAGKAAFHVACNLIWAQGVESAEEMTKVSLAEFCGWAEGWTTYVELRDKSATFSGLDADSLETMKKLRAFLNRMVDGSATFPEIYRLRADVIELLPPEQKTEQDLAQAQLDRTKYALMKTQPPSDKAAMAARKTGQEGFNVMVHARPALRVDGETLTDPFTDTWHQVMKSTHTNETFPISRATGAISIPLRDDLKAYQTAFAVAPNVIMTVGDKIPRELLGSESPLPLTEKYSWEFTFDDNAMSSTRRVFRVSKVLFAVNNRPEHGGLSFALLEIANPDAFPHPQVNLEWSKDAVRASLEKYVYVVGYPVAGGELPPGFLEPLLGKEFHTKRLMPGRLLSFTTRNGPQQTQVRKLVSDISTTHGVAGAPLVDMASDKVLGLHIEGQWKENEGKFAYAFAMPDLLDSLPESVLQRIKPGTIRGNLRLGQDSP